AACVVAPTLTAAPATNLLAPWRPATTPVPKDVPYPGMLTVDVNLQHAPQQHIFYVHETIPVSPGSFVFQYPEWIPGEHMPSGPMNNIVGLTITANGKTIPWQRDTLDMYTFHVDVPQGVTQLDLAYQFLSPFHGGEFGAGVSATPNITDVEFNQVAFYPAGYYSRDVHIQPTVEIPASWKFASALQVASQNGDTVHFKPVTFNNFVDSPLISGRYFNRVDLAPGAKVPVHLNIVGDAAKDVAVSKTQLQGFRNLVTQATALFGSHHYHHYDFLLTLSDHTDHFGLEHHQSSDDRQNANFLTSKAGFMFGATLLPHEYTHSWNGKFRRPAKLWTPNFNVPMQDNLLWVYEGETDYWQGILAVRAGLETADQFKQMLAMNYASLSHRPGREWRSLQDTATAAPLTYHSYGSSYGDWRRGTDFYQEGDLLWLDVDTKLRALSHDKDSLNTFAKAFYGMDNGSYVTKTYTFDDVVAALNKIQPYDWATFLRDRLNYTGTGLPYHGIERSGWKVVYNDTPPKGPKLTGRMAEFFGGRAVARAIGFSASEKGKVFSVAWNGPAFKAGMAPGMTVVAVGDGQAYSRDALKAAVKTARADHTAVKLLVKNGDQYSHLEISNPGAIEYAHLVRIKGTPDYLDDILKPLK
ncbi:MAG TPA: peptidase M61, partial [Rhodanobacteraceae bacterium]